MAFAPPARFLTVLYVMGAVLTLFMLADLAIRGTTRAEGDPRLWVEGGDEIRGHEAIRRHGCGGCHTIPGIREATGRVGPQLRGFRDQIYIAGVLANDPENLVSWLMSPQEINPLTAMPNLGLTDEEARDIAAYIYAHP